MTNKNEGYGISYSIDGTGRSRMQGSEIDYDEIQPPQMQSRDRQSGFGLAVGLSALALAGALALGMNQEPPAQVAEGSRRNTPTPEMIRKGPKPVILVDQEATVTADMLARECYLDTTVRVQRCSPDDMLNKPRLQATATAASSNRSGTVPVRGTTTGTILSK